VLKRAIALTVALACLQAVGAARQATPDTGPVLRYGLTAGVIENANPTDVRAASLVWVQGVADLIGLFRSVESDLFATADAAAVAVNVGGTEVLAISTLEYFSVEKVLKASPAAVFESGGEVGQEYVLVSRQGAVSLKDFVGKSIAIHAGNREWALSDVWADVLMAEAGVPDWRRVFSVKYLDRRGHAAMAVFFKQADLAIEVRSAFQTAVELNPQLGRELRVLAKSPRLLPGLICIADRVLPAHRRSYVDTMSRMHELTKYRQAFNAMRLTRIAPWDPAQLDPTRALVARQKALQAKR
jgi:hypothetical protein